MMAFRGAKRRLLSSSFGYTMLKDREVSVGTGSNDDGRDEDGRDGGTEQGGVVFPRFFSRDRSVYFWQLDVGT